MEPAKQPFFLPWGFSLEKLESQNIPHDWIVLTSGAALSLPEEFQSLVVVQDIYSSGQKVCPRYSLGGLRS